MIRSALRDAWRFTLGLVRDPRDGSFSPVAIGSIVAMAALTKGFLDEVAMRHVGWLDFIGYACAMTIASGAPIADKIISVGMANRVTIPPPPSS